MTVHEHRDTSPRAVSFGIITVSDSRGRESDSSGDLIDELVRGGGHSTVSRSLVKDDPEEILAALRKAIEGGADAIVLTGGTGITSRDVTYETIHPLLDKEMSGFGELFRHLSYPQIGSASIMSRAFAGITGGRAVFCLPGSPEAVRLALEQIILPEIGHIAREMRR